MASFPLDFCVSKRCRITETHIKLLRQDRFEIISRINDHHTYNAQTSDDYPNEILNTWPPVSKLALQGVNFERKAPQVGEKVEE